MAPFESAAMTLIGAAKDELDDSIWLASDSREYGLDGYSGDAADETTQEKLLELSSDLAWGYFGRSSVGSPFRWGLNSAPRSNWDEFTAHCRWALRTGNGPYPTTGVVMAGWIQDELRLLRISPSDSTLTANVLFGGNGRVAAGAAWTAAGMAQREMSTHDRLLIAMGATMTQEAALGFPVSLWHMVRTQEIDKVRISREQLPS